ncbi:MAG: TlpA family protein disulfide reductase [Bacteroidales bacterium]|nr:TlpA family protein disulfide reductase [Bacteroidales bacterium]
MKTINTLLIAMLFVVIACQQPEPTTVVIEGTVTNFDKDLSIYSNAGPVNLELGEQGQFRFESDSLKPGFYTLSFGTAARQEIFIKPGMHMALNADFNKLLNREIKAIEISGKGSEETQLLYQLTISNERYQYDKEAAKSIYLPKVYGQNPKDFTSYMLAELAKEYKLIDNFVDNNPGMTNDFVEDVKLNRMLAYNRNFQLYGGYQGFIKADITEVPDNFKNFFVDQIPQNDFELYKRNATYADYVRNQYYSKLETELTAYQRESLDYFKAKVAYLEECDYPDVIKQSMFNGLTIGYMRTKDATVRAYLTDVINTKVTDKASLKRWEDFKAAESSYNDGDLIPDFTYTDINGQEISLSDFRGKLVYIDLWATWCGPCMDGIPHFKKVRDHYKDKNIAFIGISLDENVKSWEKVVKENKDGLFDGVQICTGSYKCDISKYFVLNGIPQYVLLDEEGRLIKKNAPRPYNNEIYKLIDAHLK